MCFAQHMPSGEVRKVLSFFHCCSGPLFTKSFVLSFVGEQNEGGLLSRREPEVLDWVSPSPWPVSPGCCWGCHTGYLISLAFLRTCLLRAGMTHQCSFQSPNGSHSQSSVKGKAWALCHDLWKPPWKYHMVTWMLQPHSLSEQMVLWPACITLKSTHIFQKR